MKRWTVWTLLGCALALAACGGDTPAGGNGNGGDDGGEASGQPTMLIWGRGADSKYLDPGRISDGESVKVCTNLFETLIAFEPGSLELQPGLAKSWDVSEDGLTWTFHLREAKFHDGTDFDSEAVVYSFERQKDPAHEAHFPPYAYWGSNFGLVTAIRAKDPRTVEIELSEPFAPFEATMTLFSMSIVSPTAWKSEGLDENGKCKYAFHDKPVGTGPFKFARWAKNELIVLERFEDYWGAKAGVERLTFKTITDNSQRLIALENGQIDLMDGLNPQDVERVEKRAELDVVRDPGLNLAYLAMNCTKKPFDDKRVRQAVAFALSKEKIRASAYDGRGELAVVPVPPNMPGRNTEIVDRKRDLAKAKALLAEAGFPDGFKTTLWCGDNPRPYMPRPADVAVQVGQALAQIGIEVDNRVIEWTQYIPDVENGRHDMCLLGWSADYGDPDNFLFVLLDRSNAVVGRANNVSFYQSEEASKLLTAARKETGSREKRMGLYAQAQEVIFEDVPMVPLMHMPQLRAVNKRVQGYVLYPAGGEYLASCTISAE